LALGGFNITFFNTQGVMEAFHIACYGNAPYWSGCTGHIYNANGADTSAVYRNVNRHNFPLQSTKN
jgi:hypothetical protein